MTRIVIATNPADDNVTKYLDAWHKKTIDIAKEQKDTEIFELSKEKANKESLTRLIEEKNPDLVLFNGHGSCDSIFGFNQDVLIKCGENELLLEKRIVHALTCDSGKELGSQCIKIGTLAYIGYKEQFKIAFINNPEKEKLKDEIVNLFLKPAFEAVFSLLQGNSAKEAFDKSQKEYWSNLKSVIAQNSPELNQAVASRLYHNITHQVCLGDSSVHF